MHPLLVIGAGPVGLAIAKGLGEAGLDYVQVEATDHVGGNWAHGVYSTAHIISSRRTTEYADFPMPAHYPDFPSASQMRAYFEAYADHFGLRAHIRFSAPVVAVRPVGPRARDGWDVTFADGAGDAANGANGANGARTTTERFRGVLVCNGHHWSRVYPAWATAAAARGAPWLLHAKDFHEPAQLAGKRVLVVGGGNSACDIVSEAARVATRADWSLRRGYWFMPKTFFGIPSIEMIQPWLPIPVQRLVVKTLLKIVVGPYAKYGLPEPDHELFEAHPTVSTEVFHYLKHGRIHPRGDVKAVTEVVEVQGRARVTFDDGAVSDYDLVVCATGYDVALPFLPEGMVPVRGKVAELWAGMLRPEWRHLWIVGTTQPRYGLGGLVRPAAQLVAAWCKLQDELEVPLGELLRGLGLKPPRTHLMDPHQILRMLAVAERLVPLLRWRGRHQRRDATTPPPQRGARVSTARRASSSPLLLKARPDKTWSAPPR